GRAPETSDRSTSMVRRRGRHPHERGNPPGIHLQASVSVRARSADHRSGQAIAEQGGRRRAPERFGPYQGSRRGRAAPCSSASGNWRRSRLSFEKAITLQSGTNEIVLEASPADLSPRDAELETHRQAIQVVFQKREKALPPAIDLRAFSTLGGGTPTPARIPQAGQPLDFVVEVPSIRIDGRIEGKAALSEGTLDDGTGRVRRLRDFHPGKAAAFDFREEIKLLPDTKVQTIRLQGRVADSDASVLLLTVRYQPPLPEIDFIE